MLLWAVKRFYSSPISNFPHRKSALGLMPLSDTEKNHFSLAIYDCYSYTISLRLQVFASVSQVTSSFSRLSGSQPSDSIVRANVKHQISCNALVKLWTSSHLPFQLEGNLTLTAQMISCSSQLKGMFPFTSHPSQTPAHMDTQRHTHTHVFSFMWHQRRFPLNTGWL